MKNYLEELINKVEEIDRKLGCLLNKRQDKFSLRDVTIKTGVSSYKIKRLYSQGLLKLSCPPWKVGGRVPRLTLRDIEVIEAYKQMNK